MTDIEQLARETRSSIELQRAKDGTYYWTVKAYFDINDSVDRELTITRLGMIDAELRKAYL